MGELAQERRRFGARVRALRKARQLTLKQVGAALGLTETSISRVERGNQNMKLNDMMRLAALLGVSPAAFFPRDETQSSGLHCFKLLPVLPDAYIAAYA